MADEQEERFQDALANAEALYSNYLATARLTDLTGLASSWWADDTLNMRDARELLDLQPRSVAH
ncbi:MAG TPA: hypothetical protein VG032_06595 [Acidimicrobiales bacterium]|jgi:hypothetical protein|nr:hypothetical protein [Acidimicrobiales bacterium]